MSDGTGLTLLIGGARSGKSTHAEALIGRHTPPWFYVATAEALDDEMRERVEEHRRRRGADWRTIEAPLDLAGVLGTLPDGAPALVDCLTLWLSNQLLTGADLGAASDTLVKALAARRGPTFVVSNEVGQGIVPGDALSRRFRDAAGRLNQSVASIAGSVILMVAGLPLQVK
ncbi:MAG: bifunctional adenosylcobinamide kinase/adenosylcobinamide-phosphate guanylyltransferase [Rhizobiaceae bacterium]